MPRLLIAPIAFASGAGMPAKRLNLSPVAEGSGAAKAFSKARSRLIGTQTATEIRGVVVRKPHLAGTHAGRFLAAWMIPGVRLASSRAVGSVAAISSAGDERLALG